jgi:nitrogenase iron protein NifH
MRRQSTGERGSASLQNRTNPVGFEPQQVGMLSIEKQLRALGGDTKPSGRPRSLAFYGKGGVGKSTVVSNLTATLAQRGRKVLQVGCDPKRDSSRNLIKTFPPITLMDLLAAGRSNLAPEDLIMDGGAGVECIEVGGPKPGVGCAGRGLGRLFEELEGMEVFDRGYDYIFYDVLGDVVCGGFAVPMRDGYAEEVYVVTSGEFMSLYAANNIARGIANYAEQGDIRMGGLIANVKDLAFDRALVEQFAQRIGSHVVGWLEWDKVVYEAERRRQPVVRYRPEHPYVQTWEQLADALEKQARPHIPKPMSDVELDLFLEDLFGYKEEVPAVGCG